MLSGVDILEKFMSDLDSDSTLIWDGAESWLMWFRTVSLVTGSG